MQQEAVPNQVQVPQVVGEVVIQLLSDGQVKAACKAVSRNHLLMMLEATKVDLLKKFEEQQRGPGILAPPPGLRVPRVG
jgi:hypothetical protein